MVTDGRPLATLLLSFDTELGWGAIENGLWKRREAAGVYRRTRSAVRTIAGRFRELDMPATWAIVGGMLASPNDLDLTHLPCELRDRITATVREAERETFFGPDLVEMLLSTLPGHEFACHTYSHTRFSYAGLSSDFAPTEIALFRATAIGRLAAAGSLVFPRNEESFLRPMYDAGIRVVRGAPLAKNPSARNLWSRGLSRVLPPPARTEVDPSGLVRLRGSMFFNSGPGRLHRLPLTIGRAIVGLDAAIRTQGTFHVWLHPFNWAESPGLLRAFVSFLTYAAAQRDRGRLRIATMTEYAAESINSPELVVAEVRS